jgi:hypothetical protein
MRRSLVAAARPILAAFPAVAVGVAVTACGTVTITAGTVTPSPMTFSPATFGQAGSITGTHFRAAIPAGWVNGHAFFSGQPNIEVAIKKAPTTQTGPGIIVTLTVAPVDLALAPYADIVFHRDLQDRSAGKIRVLSGLHSASIAGQPAESYITTSQGNTTWTMIALWRGVDYEFQLAAPSGQFAAARSAPFHVFLQSWHWL